MYIKGQIDFSIFNHTMEQPRSVIDSRSWISVGAVIIIAVIAVTVAVIITYFETTNTPTSTVQTPLYVNGSTLYKTLGGNIIPADILRISTRDVSFSFFSWKDDTYPDGVCCDVFDPRALAFGLLYRGSKGFCSNDCLHIRPTRSCLLTVNYAGWLVLTDVGKDCLFYPQLGIGDGYNGPACPYNPAIEYLLLNGQFGTINRSPYSASSKITLIPDYHLMVLQPPLYSCTGAVFVVANSTVEL